MAADTDPTYVVIVGRDDHTRHGKSTIDYVDGIIYGRPERITATQVGGSHFVALVQFPADQFTWAKGTFERMGSFSYGASFHTEKEAAIAAYGEWCWHWSPVFHPSKTVR